MSDPVTSPDHYKAGNYECLDIMRARFGESAYKAFCTMNAFKYLFRQGRKAGVDGDEDAAKAKRYLELAPDGSMPDELERQLIEANRLNLRLENTVNQLREQYLETRYENDALLINLESAKNRLETVEEQLKSLQNATSDVDRLRALYRDQVVRTVEAQKQCAKLREQLAKLRKRKAT